ASTIPMARANHEASSSRPCQRAGCSSRPPCRARRPPKRQLAKAIMAIAVLKAALQFGIQCRKPGCAAFRAALDATDFERPKARKFALTADVIEKARAAAHGLGHPRIALCYAIQFEGAVRQWDVRGQWLPIGDPQSSAIIGRQKWVGPTWANIDQQ